MGNSINAEVELAMAIMTGIEEGICAYVEGSDKFRFRALKPDESYFE